MESKRLAKSFNVGDAAKKRAKLSAETSATAAASNVSFSTSSAVGDDSSVLSNQNIFIGGRSGMESGYTINNYCNEDNQFIDVCISQVEPKYCSELLKELAQVLPLETMKPGRTCNDEYSKNSRMKPRVNLSHL